MLLLSGVSKIDFVSLSIWNPPKLKNFAFVISFLHFIHSIKTPLFGKLTNAIIVLKNFDVNALSKKETGVNCIFLLTLYFSGGSIIMYNNTKKAGVIAWLNLPMNSAAWFLIRMSCDSVFLRKFLQELKI